jgi:hypothetical protein
MNEHAGRGAVTWTPEVARRLDDLCVRFERAWQAGTGRPDLVQSVAEAPKAFRESVLYELLLLELAYRRRAGEAPAPEDYRVFWPVCRSVIDAAFADAARPATR